MPDRPEPDDRGQPEADQALVEQLAGILTIDLTTTGRRTGRPARIEIWWFHIDDRFVITGTPGRRDWLANLQADPALIVHTPVADVPGRASEVTDPERRRRVLSDPKLGWYQTQEELDALVATSPMIELDLDLGAATAGTKSG